MSDPEGADETALRRLADERHRDPGRVHDEAGRILARLAADDPRQPLAVWVLGLAAHELNRPREAVTQLRRATRAAERLGDRHMAAVARASLAISLLATGDSATAEREIATASHQAPTSARGLVGMLQGLVHQRTGRLDDALSTYDVALSALRADRDDANVARLLLNRGTLFAYQGRIAEALADLTACEDTARRLDLWVLVAMAAHNIGFAEGRRGSAPAALAAFDRAEQAYESQGNPPRLVAALWSDRCEVFLSVGLTSDAVAAAARALQILGTTGDATHRSEALLLLARAHLADGDLEQAGARGREAAKALRTGRRPAWAALADYLVLEADILAIQDREARPPARMLDRARRIGRVLEDHGWPVEAMHVRTFVARLAIGRGNPELARSELASVLSGSVRGSARLRAETWHATALVRLAEGDRGGAKRALRRGLAVIDEHRAALGATELRAGAGTKVAELSRLGLRLVREDGRPWDVLEWAELGRAGALRLPAVSPPDDPEIDAALQELREIHASRRDAALGAMPDPSADRRIARLEERIRGRTLAGGDRARGTQAPLDSRSLVEALGAASLVELVMVDGRLLAVVVRAGRATLTELAPVEAVTSEQQYLVVALRRALGTRPGDPMWAARIGAVEGAADQLDRMILRPLGDLGEEVVVVPTGPLHSLPWMTLPTLRSRQVTIAPSAALWKRDPGRGRTAPTTTIAAGPDLVGGADEARRLARRYDGAQLLTGRGATVAAVLDALERSDLVHLAAHGSFRSDSPLFSSLRFADGPLTVYDLERLRSVPGTVVLPACNAGVVHVRTGDEVLGTASAMLSLGVGSVVAPVAPVPDEATAPVMMALHERLRHGAAPSRALLAARQAGDELHGLVATAFACIGTREPARPAPVTR